MSTYGTFATASGVTSVAVIVESKKSPQTADTVTRSGRKSTNLKPGPGCSTIKKRRCKNTHALGNLRHANCCSGPDKLSKGKSFTEPCLVPWRNTSWCEPARQRWSSKCPLGRGPHLTLLSLKSGPLSLARLLSLAGRVVSFDPCAATERRCYITQHPPPNHLPLCISRLFVSCAATRLHVRQICACRSL